MSSVLRILIVLAAGVTAFWTLRQIRRFKVKMEDAIFWTFFAAVLLVLSLFPEISFALSRMLGFISPSNFIFLVVIFLLIEKLFTISLQVSQLEDKISVLSAELALRSHHHDRQSRGKEEIKSQAETEVKGPEGGS